METVKESVEGICLKIYHLSADYAKKIKEKHSEVLKENGISGTFIHCISCTTLEILYVADYAAAFLLVGVFLTTTYSIVRNERVHTHTIIHSYVYSLSSLQLHCCLQTSLMSSQWLFHITA